MWKKKFIKFAYKLNSNLRIIGIGDCRLVRGLKNASKPLMIKLLEHNNLITIEAEGLPMYIYSNTGDTGLYLFGPYEPYMTELFKQAIKPGSKVLDIGAQFGYYSLIAAKQAGQDGRVYAFEPAPANFRLLELNIQRNRYANIIHAVKNGVGKKHKLETLFLYHNSDSHGMYPRPEESVNGKIPIECITIDEFLGGLPVDVIKMDIEGNEPYALEGMQRTISNSEKIFLFAEFAPALLNRAGVKPKDYITQLESLGFDVKMIDEHSRCLKPVPTEALNESNTQWYANLYCIKENKSKFP